MTGLTGAQLLLVEDDAGIVELLRLMLADEGVAVVAAKDGSDALGHLDGGLRPDGLVLDFILPDMHGDELLQAVRARGVCCPILLLSGWPTIETTAQEWGVPYLAKPFDVDELVARLRTMLGSADLAS